MTKKNSWKCWIFSGLNLIKHNIVQNLNIDIMNFELSNEYIAFYDKLEKSNNTYENIINLKDVNFEYLHSKNILTHCVTEGGYWEWFRAIIDKYGIVPYAYMPNAVESENYEKIEFVYTEKVKKDVIELIKLKQNSQNIEELRKIKQKFLYENYELLSKILGEPIQEFDYEYRDRNGAYQRFEKLTPIEFKNKFLSLKLENFVNIGNIPRYNTEYYKVYQKKYLGNIYGKSCVKYLNLPIEELKTLAIKQLKDNVPVYMGAHIRKFRDKKSGILDTRLYNYEEILGFKKLSKQDALNVDDISMHHVMTFTGVNLINNQPQRWKVEDSYGDKEKLNGYYIMNDNFFDEFVLSVIIDKKYLSKEQLELLEQEPIEYEVNYPI